MSASEDKNKNKNKPVNKNPKENKPSVSDQAVDSIIQKIGHAESRGQMYDKKTGKIIQNPNGSAKGPFQIIDTTWGGVEKQLGKKLKRDNWEDNVLAMKHLSKAYINRLEKAGLPVTDSNLYMLHFLGDTGGTNFLKKLQDNPNELASNYVSSKAFKDNINIFVDKNTGETRTAAEVYTEMNSRLNEDKGDNAYKPEAKQKNVPVDNLEQFRSQQNFGEQDYNQQSQESTRTEQPRIDPSLNKPNQFAPRKVADNSVPENNPVAAPKMGLGMSGNLDYLPKDFGLAFLSDEELQQHEEEQQLGQDVNMAKYGGNQDTDPPKKKLSYSRPKSDEEYKKEIVEEEMNFRKEDSKDFLGTKEPLSIKGRFDKELRDNNRRRNEPKLSQDTRSEVQKTIDINNGNQKEYRKNVKENVVKPIKLTADIASLGNYIPHPVAQAVGKTGATVSGAIDGLNVVEDLSNKDWGSALENAGGMALSAYVGGNTFKRNTKYVNQGHPLFGLKSKDPLKGRTNYIEVFDETRHMNKNNLFFNRLSLAGLGAETYNDASDYFGDNTIEDEIKRTNESENLNFKIQKRNGGEINNSALHNKIKGAFARNNNFEEGGQMRTTNKEGLLNEFNEGGRHEENKYGGIPQGQGSNGQMNTVEEGETKIGGYVLSDTLKLNDNDIKSLFLPKEIKSGMTFAEASKVVNDYLKEDPNNKILKKTVNKHIDSLTLGNEKARLAKEKLDLAMRQEMNPEMYPNQEMQLGEEFDQNQMFLGGDSSYEEMGMPGLTKGTQALTSLMTGDTDSAISGGLSAAGSIGGTLIGGPIGGAIGGALGEGIGGLINGIGNSKKAQRLANKEHMIAAGEYNNDFRYGGPNGEQPFPVNGEGYGDDLDSIEGLKSKETYIPQEPYKISGNFDTEPFDSNKAGVEYDANKERLSKEALERDNANALGKNPLQYAPILGNALGFLEAKNDKPSVINSGRIDQRFNPRYADERTLQNIVGSELNNTTNALSSATNGSEGALRSNILGAGLNKAKSMSDAYMNIDNINRGQDNEADKFNYGVNAGNREAEYRDTIFNEGSKSATKDREISARNRLFDSIGGVGREITYDNRLKNMTEYDSMGRYSPDIKAKKLELDEMIKKEEEKKKNNTARFGGSFSESFRLMSESKKLNNIEEEIRKKYQ